MAMKASEVLRAYVQVKDTVYIQGKPMSALDLTPDGLLILAQELDTFCDIEQNPVVADIIARGAPRILDAVRMVNYETKNGYEGAAARGPALVVNPMQPGDLLKYDAATSALSTDGKADWLESKTARGAAAWSGTSTYTNQMLVSSLPVLAHIYLGFVNPIEVPKVNKIQLIKDGDAWPEEVFTWNWRQTFGNNLTPTYELKQPWILPPGRSYYIAAYYPITGDDLLQPIGFTVKRATDIIAALA